ncbi:MAG: glycosyltransferase family 4 protein [Clostridia bacterium]
MPTKKLREKVVFLSTYPPRECGIATFTDDLITAIDSFGKIRTGVIALNNSKKYEYGSKVIGEIEDSDVSEYVKAARDLNKSDAELVVIEHEYGIYGGDRGEYLLEFINNLELPMVTILHTILPEPDAKQRLIINELGKKSAKIVTMANNTKRILQRVYGVKPDKIEVIHHGVPKKQIKSREVLKKIYGYENKQIISTFGLIGPGKGIENGIEAMSLVIKEHPDVMYLILGATHPALKEKGVEYRKKLEDLVENLNLKNNVIFINKFLSKGEIIEYLQLSDIYLTPYLGKDQAVSGTMAYAVGYGKAIVSTPYLYAKEMLGFGRGMLTEFNNPKAMADCLIEILQNPNKQAKMEKETIRIGRTMYWDKIAQQYIEMFIKIIKANPEDGVV